MAKFNKKKFTNLDPSVIGKMDFPELKKILEEVRPAYTKQRAVLKKYESKVWSPAAEKIDVHYDESPQIPLEEAKKEDRNKLLSEVIHLQDFFKAKTSTVPGARKVMLEQDERIFGINEKTGKPVKRLSLEDRTRMWRNYYKFLEAHPNVVNLLEGGSDRVQQYFGQWAKDTKGEMSTLDMEEAFNDLMAEYMTEDWEWDDYEYEGSDVFSGTRPY